LRSSGAAQDVTEAGLAAVVIIAIEEYLAGLLQTGVGIGYHDDWFLFAEFHIPPSTISPQHHQSAKGAARTLNDKRN
jgi:hypothetical protein